MDYTVKLPECLRRLVTMRWACHFRTTLMTARSALMQAESVPNLQCKRDVVGVRKRSPYTALSDKVTGQHRFSVRPYPLHQEFGHRTRGLYVIIPIYTTFSG